MCSHRPTSPSSSAATIDPVSAPPTTARPELEAADARVEDRAGLLAEERRVEEDVPEAAADDRAGHDAEDDEQQVVGAQAHRPRPSAARMIAAKIAAAMPSVSQRTTPRPRGGRGRSRRR